MNKINYQIPKQRFELIRENIGQILTDELCGQDYVKQFENFKVWNERFIQFDLTEMPAINVAYHNTPYQDYTPKEQQGINEYHIDIHMNAIHTRDVKGDTDAALKCQRLAGIVRYILMSQEQFHLGFDPGVVQSRWVETLEMGKITDNDAKQTIVARLTFRVKANEVVANIAPTEMEAIHTQVKLGETEKGHYFIYEVNNE